MSSSRSRWWVHKDAARVLARAEASSNTPTSTPELVYLAGHAQLLLREILPLAAGDRERLLQLHAELHRTLSERAVESVNGGAA
jgi:hypothetical protein